MGIQWMVQWWVLVHCGPTVGPLAFQQLLFKYLIIFHSFTLAVTVRIS
jgi:hypothetical protein